MADYSQLPHSVGCCGEDRSMYAYGNHVNDVKDGVKQAMISAGHIYLNQLHDSGPLDDDHYHHLWQQVSEMRL